MGPRGKQQSDRMLCIFLRGKCPNLWWMQMQVLLILLEKGYCGYAASPWLIFMFACLLLPSPQVTSPHCQLLSWGLIYSRSFLTKRRRSTGSSPPPPHTHTHIQSCVNTVQTGVLLLFPSIVPFVVGLTLFAGTSHYVFVHVWQTGAFADNNRQLGTLLFPFVISPRFEC